MYRRAKRRATRIAETGAGASHWGRRERCSPLRNEGKVGRISTGSRGPRTDDKADGQLDAGAGSDSPFVELVAQPSQADLLRSIAPSCVSAQPLRPPNHGPKAISEGPGDPGARRSCQPEAMATLAVFDVPSAVVTVGQRGFVLARIGSFLGPPSGPANDQGVSFWWLDWCCDASNVSMPGGYRTPMPAPTPSGPWADHRSAIIFSTN